MKNGNTLFKKIVSEDYSIHSVGKKISEIDINKHSLGFENKIVFVDGVLVAKPSIKNVTISGYSNFKN